MKCWVKILIGLVLGILTGLIMGEKAKIFSLFGEIFIRLLTMLVILIVFSSITVGICHIQNPKKLGRTGFRTIAFYGITTIIAIGIGVILSLLIQPGSGLEQIRTDLNAGNALTLNDLLLSLVPSNPVKSFADGNILQVIVFSVLFGVSMLFVKEKSKPPLQLLEAVVKVMQKLTGFVMYLAPYGVFALMACAIGRAGIGALFPLFKGLACNYLACLIQLLVVFSLILKYLVKVKVAPFFKGMKDAMVLAFTTSSSAAILPVSLQCAQRHLGISEGISGFVLSLGSAINMNGAAIGQSVAAIFIAQAYGIHIGPVQIAALTLACLFSAIGAPGVPGTGIVMLSSVVNVLGDAVAAVFVAKKEGEIDENIYHAQTWLDSEYNT